MILHLLLQAMSCSRKDTTFCLHPVLVGLSSNGTSYVSTIDGSGGSSWPMYNKEYFAYRSYSPWRTAWVKTADASINSGNSGPEYDLINAWGIKVDFGTEHIINGIWWSTGSVVTNNFLAEPIEPPSRDMTSLDTSRLKRILERPRSAYNCLFSTF